MGFRAPTKRAPETGGSHGYQRRHKRQAWNAKAATATNKKPVCKHRSLSTPPLLGGCATCHCQGPQIQGQLPWENTQPQAVATSCWPLPLQAHPALCTFPSPCPVWARTPESAAPLTPSCLSGNRSPQVTYTQRRGQIQSWSPGAVRTKKRKGNFSQ